MEPRGRFITLEGGEGAGKSTHARHIRDWLQQRGRPVLLTREPGGSPLAEGIRELVLRDWDEGLAPQTEALLMFAARDAHLRATIRPALAAGIDVICDRFIDSSYAYQGAGKGVSIDTLHALERMTLADLQPDLTLVLDLPPDTGLARALRRGQANRFESESAAFMARVRAAFLARAAADPTRCVVIDAAVDEAAVKAAVIQTLEARL
ncbi:MAG TPA: dTMP kinase [Solimonas sp.]